jgi:hypothetical protein
MQGLFYNSVGRTTTTTAAGTGMGSSSVSEADGKQMGAPPGGLCPFPQEWQYGTVPDSVADDDELDWAEKLVETGRNW